MRNRKRLFYIFVFVILPLIFFLLWIFSQQNNKPKDKLGPRISPPASFPSRPEFGILEILPKENLSILQDFSQPFEVTFSEKVDPQHFFYKTEPFTKLKMKQGKDEYSIFLYPNYKWLDGVTTITILQETKSITGSALKKPFVYKIKTGFIIPTNIPPGADY